MQRPAVASDAPAWALMRAVSRTMDHCLRENPAKVDVDLATRQHEAYRELLCSLGVAVEQLPADDRFPDGCFVEDPIVVLGQQAVVCRLGAASRRGEEDALARAVAARGLELVAMTHPATAEGGDVLRIGRRVFVGLSGRTNRAGCEQLAAAARRQGLRTHAVEVRAALHLKTLCTALDDERIVCRDEGLGAGREALLGYEVVRPPAREAWAANVVRIGPVVIVPSGCPETASAIERRGYVVRTLDISEIAKADGRLTCTALLGGWR